MASTEGIDLQQVRILSEAIAGANPSAGRREEAFAAAYATVDLRRIWAMQRQIAAELTEAVNLRLYSPGRAAMKLDELERRLAVVHRFETRALSRQRTALFNLEIARDLAERFGEG